jgi:hypothetical protein
MSEPWGVIFEEPCSGGFRPCRISGLDEREAWFIFRRRKRQPRRLVPYGMIFSGGEIKEAFGKPSASDTSLGIRPKGRWWEDAA